MTDTQTDPQAQGDAQPPPDDGTTITVPTQEPPAQPPRTQRTGTESQQFTQEDVERIRQEERARYSTEQQRADDLENQLAQYRKADEDRIAAETKAQREQARADKKKAEEEMELRDLIQKKDEEWEARLAEERGERERAFALLEQERHHASLQTYLAQRMAEHGDEITPELRDLVAGNSEQEIDANIQLLIQKSAMIQQNAMSAVRNLNAGRPTVGVTAPPVGPMETSQTSRTYTADELKAMTPEEYAAERDNLLRAASQSRRGQ
jgi:soluble lytic murein transglycosylase-like protein